jgi:hypothetical protein
LLAELPNSIHCVLQRGEYFVHLHRRFRMIHAQNLKLQTSSGQQGRYLIVKRFPGMFDLIPEIDRTHSLHLGGYFFFRATALRAAAATFAARNPYLSSSSSGDPDSA